MGLSDEQIRSIRKINIVACGSAYHAGVTGKYVLEGLARIPVEVDLASEFRYRDPILEADTLVIVISQSGETADSLAALREAKGRGAKVLGIVNVVGSSIAREADNVLYTWAGPEISVATTKAYSWPCLRTSSSAACRGSLHWRTSATVKFPSSFRTWMWTSASVSYTHLAAGVVVQIALVVFFRP